MENAELGGIAALIDGILSRENVAVDAVLSALMTRDPETNEFCVTAAALAQYPRLAHLTPEQLLAAPTLTGKRAAAFYPALKNPRRTLIFRDVTTADRAKIFALLRTVLPKTDAADLSPASTDAGDDADAAPPREVLAVNFEATAMAKVCYVTLDTEERAKDVALWLVAQELEPGRPVRVGIKTEAEWAFASPPPVSGSQRRKQPNLGKNKRKFGRRPPPGTPKPPATNVLAALDQFPPLDATLGQQLIRYSPKEMRVIRDAVLGSATKAADAAAEAPPASVEAQV